jgi:imidazolonepropionase-like amidohydrolase
VQFVTQYPLAVLTAIIDETHKSGRKAGCHVFGGEGLQNAITAGCDTIEHGYGLTQPQLDQMVAKGIAYDVTFARYSSGTWTTTTRRTRAASTGSSPSLNAP